MRLRYVVGFFLILFFIIGILNLLYYKSYQISKNKVQMQENIDRKEEPNMPADGQIPSNSGYYLMNQKGYVTVCLSDKETVFQYTSIPLTSLPNEIKEEIQNGKWMKDSKELYSFLENYSS